jgi:hypothetical protein
MLHEIDEIDFIHNKNISNSIINIQQHVKHVITLENESIE